MKISDCINEVNVLLDSLINIAYDSDLIGTLKIKRETDKERIYSILEIDYRREDSLYQHELTFQNKVEIDGISITIRRGVIISQLKLYIFLNRDHFLSKNKIAYPDGSVYIYEINKEECLGEENTFIASFKRYLLFIDIFKKISDKAENDFEYYFSDSQNSGVIFEIDKGCLLEDADGIDTIDNILKTYAHGRIDYTNEFKQILKKNILDISNKYKSNKVSLLVSKFTEFQLSSRRDYHIFISNFSFQRIKNTFIQEKSKYIEILDKYVSTVQNVVFSIPISIGLTLLIKNVESTKILESIILAAGFFFYSLVSSLIILQNGNSINLTKKIIDKEREKLHTISTCNGELDDSKDEFKEYFDLFDRKIGLVKLLSSIIIVALILITLLFIFKLLVAIPSTYAVVRIFAKNIENIYFTKPMVDFLRLLF
ncbi:hypothetical protein [Alkalispirochaeta alkalica]|uniref:hypothetical protein n=1 Tax=Alkalispirochaeta alkalica TaxID=46356 RepID=UPI00039D27EB|nr:hypothetical protein [Alkalispirochaeta alkalica]